MGIRAHVDGEEAGAWLDYRAVLVTLTCLMGAAYSSFLLYRNFQDVGARTGVPMATLERMEAKVRLKPASSFIWSSGRANEDLYRKDSIQTAPNGGASVRFKDGSLLEVGENSLIIVDSVENLSLGFLRGSAVLRTQNGDSRISLDKNGKAKIEILPVRMIAPEALSHYFTEGTQTASIEFQWELRPKAGQALPESVSVEVSPDRVFRKGSPTTREIVVPAGAHRVSASLGPGDYYWRVLASGQSLGEPARFAVDGVSGLKPLFPEASDKVSVFGKDATVQFRWVPPEDLSEDLKVRHQIQIASDPSFKNVAHSQAIAATAGSSVISDAEGLFGTGEHYWRIVSQYESQHSHLTIRSPTQEFKVEKIVDVPMELISPAENESLRMDPAKKIRFAWSSDVDGVSYRWQLRAPQSAAQSPAQSPVQTVDTSGARAYSWAAAHAGQYQWRVEAVYQDKVVGESVWRSFTALQGAPIALREPVDGKEFLYWTDPPQFDFSWNADPQARGYLLETASDAMFKDAQTAKTSSTELSSQKIQLKPGSRFWRVSALDASGQVIDSSAPRRMDYGVFPPLRAPASSKPDAGAVINPLEMDHDPAITWSPVADAESYEVTIKQGDHVVSQQVVPRTSDAQSPSLSMKDLQAGQYAYTIRAIDKLQRKGEAASDRKFEVTYGQPLAAPEALSPEVQ